MIKQCNSQRRYMSLMNLTLDILTCCFISVIDFECFTTSISSFTDLNPSILYIAVWWPSGDIDLYPSAKARLQQTCVWPSLHRPHAGDRMAERQGMGATSDQPSTQPSTAPSLQSSPLCHRGITICTNNIYLPVTDLLLIACLYRTGIKV